MKKILFALAIFIIVFSSQAQARRRAPIVVPTANSYTLVSGRYIWSANGFYSIHPPIIPQIVKTIVYLPAWNGVYWYYSYAVKTIRR